MSSAKQPKKKPVKSPALTTQKNSPPKTDELDLSPQDIQDIVTSETIPGLTSSLPERLWWEKLYAEVKSRRD